MLFYCFFSKRTFSKNSFRNPIRMCNGLDLDQDQHSVGSDMGFKLFAKLSADNKSHC